LHGGNCPAWLFPRMKKLSGIISEIIIEEHGAEDFLKRLSNPFFFQSLGCVIGFDWHSSCLTTTVCGALKEALNEKELGIYVAGGKGKVSRKAPAEIANFSDKLNLSSSKSQELIKASKLSAKVDNACVQDNYQLYHHIFVLTEKGKWSVIQQGMNLENRMARRYHWLSDNVVQFTEEPHSAICAQQKEKEVLDMTAKKSREARKISVDLVNDFEVLRDSNQRKIMDFSQPNRISFCSGFKVMHMPAQHHIKNELKLNYETLKRAAEIQPKNYEELIMVQGFGPKHVRALALISELIYGVESSWQDPANFSFSLGGKDGYPYPIDRKVYDDTIVTLKEAVERAKIGQKEKLNALSRLRAAY